MGRRSLAPGSSCCLICIASAAVLQATRAWRPPLLLCYRVLRQLKATGDRGCRPFQPGTVGDPAEATPALRQAMWTAVQAMQGLWA